MRIRARGGVAIDQGGLVVEGALQLNELAANPRVAELQGFAFERTEGDAVARALRRRRLRMQPRVDQALVPAGVDRAQLGQRTACRLDRGQVHRARLPVKESPAGAENQRHEGVTDDA